MGYIGGIDVTEACCATCEAALATIVVDDGGLTTYGTDEGGDDNTDIIIDETDDEEQPPPKDRSSSPTGAPSLSPVASVPIEECPSNRELLAMYDNNESCADYIPNLWCPLSYIVIGCTVDELMCEANDWVDCFDNEWIRGMFRRLSLEQCADEDTDRDCGVDLPKQGDDCDPNNFVVPECATTEKTI